MLARYTMRGRFSSIIASTSVGIGGSSLVVFIGSQHRHVCVGIDTFTLGSTCSHGVQGVPPLYYVQVHKLVTCVLTSFQC